MPEYRIRETGEIITNLAAQFPNVSIPVVLKTEDFDALGIDPILEGARPAGGPFCDIVREGVVEIDGAWYWRYVAVDWSEEQIAAATEQQWASVRDQRNRLLAESDWIVTKSLEAGEDVPTAWKDYRQALRDVTEQTDPFAIVWPTKPE